MSSPHTILVVEDDPALRAGLTENLEIEGYRVKSAASLKAARDMVLARIPDLILLDLRLPDGDGLALCRQLRSQGDDVRVIVLTARGEEADKLLGFEVGADDYIVKPFSLRELLARVHAQLRRHEAPTRSSGPVEVGAATVDFKRHRLEREGTALEMSAKEMELLRYLVAHRGEVISRDHLLSEVWGHRQDVVTRTVDNFVVRLRKKIEPDPSAPRYLITVHGSGYKLVEQ